MAYASPDLTGSTSASLRIGAYLSLTGRYARFGRQAADGLRAWQTLQGDIELTIDDDAGDPRRLLAGLPDLARRCDLLLGPYSTRMMRAARRAIEHTDAVLWNHGGAGDDVQTSPSGRIVSVLTPTSRYAEPFLRRVAGHDGSWSLWIVQGRGSFGRQVADGAEALARELGMRTERHGPDVRLPPAAELPEWDVFSVGTFEDDVAAVQRTLGGGARPRALCAVAAGVGEFALEVQDTDGLYGIAQWFPGRPGTPRLGPTEAQFLAAYRELAHSEPDYPAVQAVAAAIVAIHCTQLAGTVDPQALRAAAASLDTATLFGPFRIDASGRQINHQTVLVQWARGRLSRAV